MRKLVTGTFVSLDGVMQAPGGPSEDTDGGFDHGGWVFPYYTEKWGERVQEWMNAADVLLLGRKTYDIFAAHWPRVSDEDEMAARLNGMPKYVVSRTLKSADWNNSTVIGDIPNDVAALKEAGDGEIQVTGSGNLIQSLMEHDLVDEYRLIVFPVLIGSGKRLFAEGTAPSNLKLTSSQVLDNGVGIFTFERAGKLEQGSFELEETDPQ